VSSAAKKWAKAGAGPASESPGYGVSQSRYFWGFRLLELFGLDGIAASAAADLAGQGSNLHPWD
jgi:hypothetical protein